MTAEGSTRIISRSRQRRPAKRRLALIAWTVDHPPPDASVGYWAMIAKRLAQLLTDAERHQVSEFIADETAMRKVLNKRVTKR